MRIASAILLMLGLTAATSSAQTLADLARQQREGRIEAPDSETKITTEVATSSRPGASLAVVGATTVEAVTDATDTAEVPAEGTSAIEGETEEAVDVDGEGEGESAADDENAPPDTEEAWREIFEEARTEIQRSEQRLELAELELGELNRQLLTRSDIYNREYQLAPVIAAKEAEIVEARQRVNQANQDLEQLRTDLRTSGLPAGWGR